MKYSFSTLGCPDWTFNEIISAAKDLGYDGIEIRGIENDIYAPDIKAFSTYNIEKNLNELKQANLEISCLASACYLNSDDKDYVKEAFEYIDLGKKINAKTIRVLGDINPEPSKFVDDKKVIDSLILICDYALEKNQTIVIETNGAYSDSERLLSVLKAVNKTNLGVIWDIQHPYRVFNEPVVKTFNTLKPYIKHVHIKDSIIENHAVKYKMTGFGDMPIKEVLALLKANIFDGYVSFEWVKRWNKDLEDAGIVLSQFIRSIKFLEK